jgi:hypothetical protein
MFLAKDESKERDKEICRVLRSRPICGLLVGLQTRGLVGDADRPAQA